MSDFTLSPAAHRDLEEIWEYIAADSVDAADRWLAKLGPRPAIPARADPNRTVPRSVVLTDPCGGAGGRGAGAPQHARRRRAGTVPGGTSGPHRWGPHPEQVFESDARRPSLVLANDRGIC